MTTKKEILDLTIRAEEQNLRKAVRNGDTKEGIEIRKEIDRLKAEREKEKGK